MVSYLLFIEALLGEGLRAKDCFGVLFLLMLVFFFAYAWLAGKNFWLSMLSNIACVFTIFLYFTITELDHYWFLDDAGPLAWIGMVFVILVFLTACFSVAKAHIFMIKHLFDNPIYSIICVVIGLAWAFTWFFAVGSLMVDHSGAALLCLIASVPSGFAADAPTIYVKGEGYVNVPGYKNGDRRTTSNYGNKYRKNDQGEWGRM